MSGCRRPDEGYFAGIECHGAANCDGRRQLGSVFEDGSRVAERADGHDLGSFPDHNAATEALRAAKRAS